MLRSTLKSPWWHLRSRSLLPLAGLVLSTALSQSLARESLETRTDPSGTRLGAQTLSFIENRGQIPFDAEFYVEGTEKTVLFTRRGVEFILDDGTIRSIVSLEFVDANAGALPRGRDPSDTRFLFFRGRPEEWLTDVPAFGRLVYEDVWPGIDLLYSLEANRLKYEFVVDPGADPEKIRFEIRGAQDARVGCAGHLILRTEAGTIEDNAPIAWQHGSERREEVVAAYSLHREADGEACFLGFRLGPYDRERPLILDPDMLVYCGYIGTPWDLESARDVAVDSEGHAFVGGIRNDAGYVAKVRADGVSLEYCAFFQGDGFSYVNAIAVDGQGNVIVAGSTTSTEATFPVVVGPDLTHNGRADAFIARLRAEDWILEYCGFVGGAEDDWGHGVGVDAAGNAFVTGITASDESSFPVTIGPDLTHNGGWDAFVTGVSADGAGLTYCGYVGGSEMDRAYDLAADATGHAYLVGMTGSSEIQGFPVQVGPDLSYNGAQDLFVAKVALDGSSLDYCGYIGGGDYEGNYPYATLGIAVDGTGCAYVTGATMSDEQTFPVTVGPDLTYNGNEDAFVAKVASDGAALEYCGYLGGSQVDSGYAIAVDGKGHAFLTGRTRSGVGTFPVIAGPELEIAGNEYGADAFVAQVNASGSALVSCGYLGGLQNDVGEGIAVDDAGNVYVSGMAQSNQASFPVVVGPDLFYKGGASDGFIAKVPAYFACQAGAVDLGAGGAAVDVLTVNGGPGSPWRTVNLSVGDPITVQMIPAPQGPVPAPFVLYAWIGEPSVETLAPHPKNLGTACFPTPVVGGDPQPARVWNNIGHPEILGPANLPSEPAPSTPVDVPAGFYKPVIVTLQGLILDDGSAANRPISLTNAVTVRIQSD